MSKISAIAKLICAEGKNAEFESALATLIDASNEEAGTEIYSAHRGDDNAYWFFELYRDADALAVHGKGEQMRAAMGAIGVFMAGRPEVYKLEPLVGKGLAI